MGATDGVFVEESLIDELGEVGGGRGAGYMELLLDEGYLRVGMAEKAVDEVLAVQVGELILNAGFQGGHQLPDFIDRLQGVLRRCGYTCE